MIAGPKAKSRSVRTDFALPRIRPRQAERLDHLERQQLQDRRRQMIVGAVVAGLNGQDANTTFAGRQDSDIRDYLWCVDGLWYIDGLCSVGNLCSVDGLCCGESLRRVGNLYRVGNLCRVDGVRC